MAADEPYSAETVDWVAETLGRPREWVAGLLGEGGADRADRQVG